MAHIRSLVVQADMEGNTALRDAGRVLLSRVASESKMSMGPANEEAYRAFFEEERLRRLENAKIQESMHDLNRAAYEHFIADTIQAVLADAS